MQLKEHGRNLSVLKYLKVCFYYFIKKCDRIFFIKISLKFETVQQEAHETISRLNSPCGRFAEWTRKYGSKDTKVTTFMKKLSSR